MSPQSEPTLSRVLHELTDVPGPANLTDRALAGARRRRRVRAALTGSAAVAVAGVLAVPLALQSRSTAPTPAPDTQAGAPSTAPKSVPRSALGPCRFLPEKVDKGKQVEPADWPEFVRIATGLLPQRGDYVMQSGYSVCDTGPASEGNRTPIASAYAVINLGAMRENGHLTLNLHTYAEPGVTTCQGVRDAIAAPPPPDSPPVPRPTLLFCEEGPQTTPMVFAIAREGGVTVTAQYADNRVVYMESIAYPPTDPVAIGVDELRPVVTSRALVELLPVG